MKNKTGRSENLLGRWYSSISDPAPDRSDEERFEKALRYAVEVAGRWTKDGEVFIPAIEHGLTELDSAISPVWLRKGVSKEADEKFSHFDFPDWSSEKWHAVFCVSRRHRELILQRVGFNIMVGAPLPETLRIIAGVFLQGSIDPLPPTKGKPTMKHRDTLIVGIAKTVHADFGYPVGANKATFLKKAVPLCGCTFAAAALHAWDVHVTFTRANEICSNKGLPVEKASKAGVFSKPYFFVSRALTGSGDDPNVVLDRARNKLLPG